MTLGITLSDFQGFGALIARPICSDNVRQAYLLAQLHWQNLSFVDWLNMVARSSQYHGASNCERTGAHSGWIAVEGPRQCVYAIGYCEMVQSLDRGATLRASNVVVVDQPLAQAALVMCQCLSFLAKKAGARSLSIECNSQTSSETLADMQESFGTHGWLAKTSIALQAQPMWN